MSRISKQNIVSNQSMVLNKTSENTTNKFQILFENGFSELYIFFLCQLQLKTLFGKESALESSISRRRSSADILAPERKCKRMEIGFSQNYEGQKRRGKPGMRKRGREEEEGEGGGRGRDAGGKHQTRREWGGAGKG